jgi:hypothetical protein
VYLNKEMLSNVKKIYRFIQYFFIMHVEAVALHTIPILKKKILLFSLFTDF